MHEIQLRNVSFGTWSTIVESSRPPIEIGRNHVSTLSGFTRFSTADMIELSRLFSIVRVLIPVFPYAPRVRRMSQPFMWPLHFWPVATCFRLPPKPLFLRQKEAFFTRFP